jgi:hypothetical protein
VSVDHRFSSDARAAPAWTCVTTDPRIRFGTPDHDRQTLVTHDYDTQTLDTPDHDRLNLVTHDYDSARQTTIDKR